jgi:hypothetical protein
MTKARDYHEAVLTIAALQKILQASKNIVSRLRDIVMFDQPARLEFGLDHLDRPRSIETSPQMSAIAASGASNRSLIPKIPDR